MNTVGKIKLWFFIVLGILLFFVYVYVKSYNANSISRLYLIYSFIATAYFCSRILAALLYKTPGQKKYTKTPTVSFIIAAYNEEKAIADTIKRCFEVDYPDDKFDVIVINDGSTDGTWNEIVKAKKVFPALQAINLKENCGKRKAMVHGIKLSKSEIFIQLDSDSYIEKNSLRPLVSVLEDKKIAGVSAHASVANKNDSLLTKMQTAYYFLGFRFHRAAESTLRMVFCCPGCCSAYRREYVLAVLDQWDCERFFGAQFNCGDDRSLTRILIKEGYDTVYCDIAQAYTIVPNSLKAYLKQQRRWKRSWIICSFKTLPYILKREPFIAITYFFPQILMNFLAPAVIIHSVLLFFYSSNLLPLVYFMGVISLYFFYIIFYSVYEQDQYRPYIFIWQALNILLSTIIFPYAFFTLMDDSWGTR